ncbi:MAG: efflux RND transporter periplasmic adaptor subunit [Deltaproteobacteria bacterium]|nr:efflux RND transporter periplasmic adaptor subunit [Deltaproteobacteria bacterium]
MKGKIVRWGIVILILAGIGAYLWHVTRPEPVEIVVHPVERGLVEKTVSNTRAGTVKACRRAKLSPGIGGQITTLPVRVGQQVKKGQLLLELWNKDLSAQLSLAKREEDAARDKKKAVCLRAEIARREADRLLRLRKTGAASEERTDRAVTEAKALDAECAAAESAVSVSQARAASILANLERTRLVAPFDGVIAEINGELSEYVTPSPIGIPTPPAVDIIDTSCFYVDAPIDEVDAPLVSVGMPARIRLDAFRDRLFTGKVERVDAYVLDRERQARTVEVEVRFAPAENPEKLLAGYSADIDVVLEVHPGTLRVPTESILDNTRVFVFDRATGTISARTVEIGISNWDFTEIRSGLEAGEQVILNVDAPGVENGAKAVIVEKRA